MIFSEIVQDIFYRFILRDCVAYARKIGVECGDDCNIIANPRYAFGSEPWLIQLGNHVEITAGVTFVTHEGGLWTIRGIKKELKELDYFNPIIVKNNVMIGMNSIIMPGVTIGNNVIIGAGSVVTKDIPDNQIVAGAPAKSISDIDDFLVKISNSEYTVPTKGMNQSKKKEYLMRKFPEWFSRKC